MPWPYYALTALSLSVGWGIRGNFGHEFGAMIPGALAALAVALLSGREDWTRRATYFGLFGALGWSFGGSISYMQVLAYTHSGHSPSVLYGFACLFVIGFLWAALGGAGTALPAVLDRERLTELFGPMTAVFLAWWVEGVLVEPWLRAQGYGLNWFDTDWLGALVAILTALAWAGWKLRIDRATSLILHLGIGWWVGFLVLVVGLGLRMTPPRGDNWSGCLGMTAGLFVYCARYRLGGVALAALVTGLIGGIGFAGAAMLKLVEVTCGLETNWHSILEQSTGLFNGLALAVAMAMLARRVPEIVDKPPLRDWTTGYATCFVLLVVTYLNLRKNPPEWVRVHAMPATLYGLSASSWFDLGYLALSVAVLVLAARHRRRPLAIIPSSSLGSGQLLFLAFLWWMVAGNFARALVAFAPQRLVTEGVIHLNAVLCSLLLLLGSPEELWRPAVSPPHFARAIRVSLAIGLLAVMLSILVDWSIVRAIYGDRFAGHAGLSIRFGPNATTKGKP